MRVREEAKIDSEKNSVRMPSFISNLNELICGATKNKETDQGQILISLVDIDTNYTVNEHMNA